MSEAPRGLLAASSRRRRWWRTALALAVFVLTVVGCLEMAVNPVYEGRMNRDVQRVPVPLADGESAAEAVARYHFRDEDLELSYVSVFVFGLIDPAAPPPPGVPRWPLPGEVFVSPALHMWPGSRDFIRRYGEVVGGIDRDSLADPGERVAYVGAEESRMDPDRTYLLRGFGIERPAYEPQGEGIFGSAAYQGPRYGFWMGIALFGVVPALILSAVAIRLDGENRNQRLTLLRLLGASPSTVRRAVLTEVGPPAAIGAGVALAGVLMATVRTWQVPGLEFFLVAEDLRAAWPWFILVAVAAVAWTVLASLWTFRGAAIRRRGAVLGARPTPAPRPARRWPLLVLVIVLFASNYLYRIIYPINPSVSTMVAMGGAALSLALVGSATSSIVRGVADMLAWWARGGRANAPLALIAGRDLGALSKPAVRSTAGLAVAAVLAIQVAVWGSVAVSDVLEARIALQRNAGASLLVTSLPRSPLARTIESLPGSPFVIGLTADGALIGRCVELKSVIGECSDVVPAHVERDQVHLWVSPGTEIRQVRDLEGLRSAEQLLVFSAHGESLDRNWIAAHLNRVEPAPLGVEWPGQGWAIGGQIYADQGRWFSAGGAMGVLIVLTMTAFALAFETLRLSRRFAPLGAFVGRPSSYTWLSAGMIGVPLVASGLSGLVVGILLVIAPTSPGQSGTMPVSLIAGLVCVLLAVSFALVLVVGRTVQSMAAGWMPGTDEQ